MKITGESVKENKPNLIQAYFLSHEGVQALARAEQQGIRVDLEYCERKKIHLTRKIERLEQKFYDTKFFRHWQHSVGGKKVNINSNTQLSNYLYKVKKLKPVKETESEQGATDEESLIQLNIPELNDLLEIRKLKKVRDTYLDAFVREQVNGVIHPSFNLHLVRTFRSSSDRPNFQNIPKRDKEAMMICRKALFPRVGHQLMEVDYSGLEVRIAACYHQDSTMLKYINDPTTDMHADMAKQIYVIDKFDKSKPGHKLLRTAAKNGFVFPQFYGDYYANNAKSMACNWGKLPEEGRWKAGQGVEIEPGLHLADHLISVKLTSLKAFTEHLKEIEYDFWNNRFSEYQKWKQRWWRDYQRKGWIEMKTGFRCSGVMSRNDCINYPVQGAAFHCLLWSFNQLDKSIYYRDMKSRLIGQIHDAIVFDIYPPELEEMKTLIHRIMCEDIRKAWPWIIVPLDVEADLGDVDASWADLKPEKF